MKVILSGATGFIGGNVLKRLLAVPSITLIVALSRRPLQTSDPKLKVVIHKDFLKYDDETLAQLQGAQACIWCLGKATSGKEVHMDYTMAAANAFEDKLLGHLGGGRKLKFVYLSGALAEKDQDKTVWLLGGARKLRGEVENKVLAIQTQHPDHWQSFVARPAYVTVGEPILRFVMPGSYIPVEELAAALVDTAVNGSETERLENVDLRRRGRAALATKS
ncbi:hypothetical protein M409DRAFT_67822 [Zasmidium cellare ATCC 36951]|uniref:NAD(P)-binding domain-containing protein n=1 Tax=Zasmidium cellare ATCC 36951 TaxID=1080233 RepID=A0A6A6CCE2_ZASCE|nr:uncharacterized protein M409DRAFT_67822 [Zasmidium cellare ATCC 36951]KAF2164725.1 hypothetical protein M409DRAFT_67822 [Zasmidium cellare ATCC 36951]